MTALTQSHYETQLDLLIAPTVALVFEEGSSTVCDDERCVTTEKHMEDVL